jgi:hypothetical protein
MSSAAAAAQKTIPNPGRKDPQIAAPGTGCGKDLDEWHVHTDNEESPCSVDRRIPDSERPCESGLSTGAAGDHVLHQSPVAHAGSGNLGDSGKGSVAASQAGEPDQKSRSEELAAVGDSVAATWTCDDFCGAHFCYSCGAKATYFCEGNDQGPCSMYMAFDASCCGGAAIKQCQFCRLPGKGVANLTFPSSDLTYCMDCAHSFTQDELNKCRTCKRRVCERCALQWGGKPAKFYCFADYLGKKGEAGGHEAFLADRMAAAYKLIKRVEKIVQSGQQAKRKVTANLKLAEFGWMIVIMNGFLQYELLNSLLPLLRKVLDFQQTNHLPPCISRTQALLLHLPSPDFDQLVQVITNMQAAAFPSPPTVPCLPMRVSGGHSVHDSLLSLQVIFVIFDLVDHPLMQLLYELLMDLLNRDGVKCMIFALNAPDLETDLVAEVYHEFHQNGMWFQHDPESESPWENVLRSNGGPLHLIVDCVGGQHGFLEGKVKPIPGHHAKFVVTFLNDASNCNMPKWISATILDRYMLEAVPNVAISPPGPAALPPEPVVAVSLWQPPLPKRYMDAVESTERARGDIFNIFVPTPLNRLYPGLWTLCCKILQCISVARIVLYGHPMVNVNEVKKMARKFALQENLDPKLFVERIVFWGHLSMEDGHLQRQRRWIHLVVSWGNYPGHTATNAAYTAGLAVLTGERNDGGGGPASRVPGAMARFMGLPGLVALGDTETEICESILRKVQQLHDDPDLRCKIGEHVDDLRRTGKALFNRTRSGDDFLAALKDGLVKGKLEGIYATCQPERAVLVVDEAGGAMRWKTSPVPGVDLARRRESIFGPTEEPCRHDPIEEPWVMLTNADFGPSGGGSIRPMRRRKLDRDVQAMIDKHVLSLLDDDSEAQGRATENLPNLKLGPDPQAATDLIAGEPVVEMDCQYTDGDAAGGELPFRVDPLGAEHMD